MCGVFENWYNSYMHIFSRYAHPFEKTVNSFFGKIRSTSDPKKVHKQLESLLQQNTIVVNLWMEKRFKNYTNLTKSKRKQLYANAQIIGQVFDQFVQMHTPNAQYPTEQQAYMAAIMAFLKPGTRYNYIPTASFARLLNDPRTTVLEGDCNQIVTLYTFLYARKYPITDLQAKLLPEHVCLHLQGVDVEATNATFQHYTEHDGIVPITELIAINLLDVSDFREMTAKITEASMVEGAKLAYVISSNRALVQKNLRVSYHNLALYAAQRSAFSTALFYANRCQDPKLLNYVHHTAAEHFLKKKSFSKARFYAEKLSDTQTRQDFIRATYTGEYNSLASTVQNDRTLLQMKKHKATYRKMLTLAKKSGLSEQITQLQTLLKQL